LLNRPGSGAGHHLLRDYPGPDALIFGYGSRIEEYLPLEYLEDLSSIPGLEDLLEEETGFDIEEVLSEAISEDLTEARDIPLAGFDFIDIGTSFVYPVGWDIAIQGYEVAFYHPENYAYLSRLPLSGGGHHG